MSRRRADAQGRSAGCGEDRLHISEPPAAAFVLLVTIPFTYSISHGIGYGFITYVVIKLLARQWQALHPLMLGTAAAFAAYFALL